MKIIDERETQKQKNKPTNKNKDRKEQGGDRSYSERVRALTLSSNSSIIFSISDTNCWHPLLS